MVNNELHLSFGLPGLNEIIKAAKIPSKPRRNGKRAPPGIVYSAMKKKNTEMVEAELVAQGCIPAKPFQMIDIEFIWTEKGRARDPDNVRVGAKFVLDAMVHRGIIPDDSMKYIKLLADKFVKGSERAVIVKWSEVI